MIECSKAPLVPVDFSKENRMKERIKAYLADGLKPADVATILGCSPGYVSQLMKDENFKAEVEAALLANSKPQDEVLESRYHSLEHNIVKRMNEELAGAEIGDLTKALDSVTRANDARYKRKHPALQQPGVNVTQVAHIYLPQHVMPAPVMTLNEKSEVVAIDNKPLAPMSASGVKNLFAQMTLRNSVNEFEEVPNGPRTNTLETSANEATHQASAYGK